MKALLGKLIRKVLPLAFLAPEGDAGIAERGHREYVGGQWDQLGRLQFEFLRSHGMQPCHYLIDVACGALRLGVHAIPYLDRGHYLGIEKEPGLVRAGLEEELDPAIRADKAPVIVISDSFEFERLGHAGDFAIAQSLFSHFPPPLIVRCLERLRPSLAPGADCFATFFEVPKPIRNPTRPHDHGRFAYTRDEMMRFGREAGYDAEYIGDWNHPRRQVMMAYRPLAGPSGA